MTLPTWAQEGQKHIRLYMSQLLDEACRAVSLEDAEKKLEAILHQVREFHTLIRIAQALPKRDDPPLVEVNQAPQPPSQPSLTAALSLPAAPTLITPTERPVEAPALKYKSDPRRRIFVGTFTPTERGGELATDVGKKINVPLYIALRFGYMEGDVIEAQEKNERTLGGWPKYHFTKLASETGEADPDRVESPGTLEGRHDSQFWKVKVHGADNYVLVGNGDITFLSLTEGDAVKVAYYKSWLDKGDAEGVVLSKLATEAEPIEEEPSGIFLDSPRVLVVGPTSQHWHHYAKALTKLGADGLNISGFVYNQPASSLLSLASVVVVMRPLTQGSVLDRITSDYKERRGDPVNFFVTDAGNLNALRDFLVSTVAPVWNAEKARDSANAEGAAALQSH